MHDLEYGVNVAINPAPTPKHRLSLLYLCIQRSVRVMKWKCNVRNQHSCIFATCTTIDSSTICMARVLQAASGAAACGETDVVSGSGSGLGSGMPSSGTNMAVSCLPCATKESANSSLAPC